MCCMCLKWENLVGGPTVTDPARPQTPRPPVGASTGGRRRCARSWRPARARLPVARQHVRSLRRRRPCARLTHCTRDTYANDSSLRLSPVYLTVYILTYRPLAHTATPNRQLEACRLSRERMDGKPRHPCPCRTLADFYVRSYARAAPARTWRTVDTSSLLSRLRSGGSNLCVFPRVCWP